MTDYQSMDKNALESELKNLKAEYEDYKAQGLKLNMARGVPSTAQLELSLPMLDILKSDSDCLSVSGADCRNYGILDGIDEAKTLFAQMLGVKPENVFIGGNSSLNMMFDTIACFSENGVAGEQPWLLQGKIKFLCPAPGYDRHFGVTGFFKNIEMITIPMTENGPDMDMVEKYVENDSTVKGIWCVPKYSNPDGITYSDETVKRFAALKPAAKDFRIMWDNAYCIHDLTDTPDTLLNLYDECLKNGNEDLPIMFCSTSKITFPGSGVSALAASKNNLDVLKSRYKFQTIGYDKLNMLRHIRFFNNYEGVVAHMQKHKAILAPKFELVISKLTKELGDKNIASWHNPNGGYFVSVNVLNGCAKKVVALCKEAGINLTGAGATYPYGIDPNDSNIRIAPSFPPLDELAKALDIFCLCTKIAAIEKLLDK